MPRRIYTYDAGQGWDMFNLMSHASARTCIVVGDADLRLQLLRRAASAARSPATIRGTRATLEWSIPSPPPEYNFAEIPTVTSRYPLWDLKHPERTAEMPHTHEGVGRDAHVTHGTRDAECPMHIETGATHGEGARHPDADATIKPLVCAARHVDHVLRPALHPQGQDAARVRDDHRPARSS